MACQHTRNVSKKLQKDIWSRTGYIPIFVYFQQGSKITNRLTDIQEIQTYLEIVYQHPRNLSKKLQKDILSRPGVLYVIAHKWIVDIYHNPEGFGRWLGRYSVTFQNLKGCGKNICHPFMSNNLYIIDRTNVFSYFLCEKASQFLQYKILLCFPTFDLYWCIPLPRRQTFFKNKSTIYLHSQNFPVSQV